MLSAFPTQPAHGSPFVLVLVLLALAPPPLPFALAAPVELAQYGPPGHWPPAPLFATPTPAVIPIAAIAAAPIVAQNRRFLIETPSLQLARSPFQRRNGRPGCGSRSPSASFET